MQYKDKIDLNQLELDRKNMSIKTGLPLNCPVQRDHVMEIKYKIDEILKIKCTGCKCEIDEERAEKGVNVCKYCQI